MHIFGQIWLFLAKILIFWEYVRGENHLGKNHLRTLFALYFGRAWNHLGQNCQYLAKKEKPIGFVTQAHNSLYTF